MKSFFSRVLGAIGSFIVKVLLFLSKLNYKQWFLLIGFFIGILLLVFGIIDFEQLLKLLLAIAGIPLMITYGKHFFVLLFFLLMGLSSCMSYQKAIKRFGQNKVDTVWVTETITQTVPADSVSYVVPLDHISKLESAVWAQSPSGARVIIQPEVHEKVKYIRIAAQCPEKSVSTSITRPKQVIIKNDWGVSPGYKTWSKIFGFTLLGLVLLLALGFVLKRIKFFGF